MRRDRWDGDVRGERIPLRDSGGGDVERKEGRKWRRRSRRMIRKRSRRWRGEEK